jgi:hypothetical protein
MEQAAITGQQDASLLRGTAQELVIGGRRIVDDIDPHHTQPFRQLPEHGIGNEALVLHGKTIPTY